jgi:hypothetical protein
MKNSDPFASHRGDLDYPDVVPTGMTFHGGCFRSIQVATSRFRQEALIALVINFKAGLYSTAHFKSPEWSEGLTACYKINIIIRATIGKFSIDNEKQPHIFIDQIR